MKQRIFKRWLVLALVPIASLSCKVSNHGDDADVSNAVDRGKNSRLEFGVQMPSQVPENSAHPAIIARQRPGQSARNWGTPYNIDILVSAAERLSWEYEKKLANADPMVVGDMSKQSGGNIGHASHRMGLDTDVSYYDNRTSGKPKDVFVNYSANRRYFDTERNLRFVELVHEEAERCGTSIPFIFSDPPLIDMLYKAYQAKNPGESRGSFTSRYHLSGKEAGHDDHFHVRVGFMGRETCVRPAPTKGAAVASTTPPRVTPAATPYGRPAVPSTTGTATPEHPAIGWFNLTGDGAPAAAQVGPESFGEEVALQDEPWGDNCGIYTVNTALEARVRDEFPADSAKQKAGAKAGDKISLKAGQKVSCVSTFTQTGAKMLEFKADESDDGTFSTSRTLFAAAENFDHTNAPAEKAVYETLGASVDVCVEHAGESLAIAEETGLTVHAVDSAGTRTGVTVAMLQKNDIVKVRSRWNKDGHSWLTVEILASGVKEGKGVKGVVLGNNIRELKPGECKKFSDTGVRKSGTQSALLAPAELSGATER